MRLRGLARRAWFRWGLVGSGCMAAVANVYPLLPLFFADLEPSLLALLASLTVLPLPPTTLRDLSLGSGGGVGA